MYKFSLGQSKVNSPELIVNLIKNLESSCCNGSPPVPKPPKPVKEKKPKKEKKLKKGAEPGPEAKDKEAKSSGKDKDAAKGGKPSPFQVSNSHEFTIFSLFFISFLYKENNNELPINFAHFL